MEGNCSDGDRSLGSECSTSSVKRELMEVPEGNSVDDVDLIQNCNSIGSHDSHQSDQEETPMVRNKKRVHILSDSESESRDANGGSDQAKKDYSSGNEAESPINKTNFLKSTYQKSRLHKMSTSEEESDSKVKESNVSSNDKQGSRIKNKRNKLRQKFKNLHTKKNKAERENNIEQNHWSIEESHSSNDEATSIYKIEQKIKENAKQFKSSLYDPDTSDEESSIANKKTSVEKKGRKSTKPTSPKPLRMSAKQAMENMQKIKSESNRMLREKEVSLPYHRPKALSLKDIMNRRRVAVAADGKALPIKMNEDQLKQYAQLLEQRQKEMIELCKSDSEDEEEVPRTEKIDQSDQDAVDLPEIASLNDTLFDNLSQTEGKIKSTTNDPVLSEKNVLDAGIPFLTTPIVPSPTADNPDTNINGKELNTELEKAEMEHKTENLQSLSIDTNLEDTTAKERENNAALENNSMEMELVYNDSVEDDSMVNTEKNESIENTNTKTEVNENAKPRTEIESQLISLRFDTAKSEQYTENFKNTTENVDHTENDEAKLSEVNKETNIEKNVDDFSDGDMNIDDIDALIENTEIVASLENIGNFNSPIIKDQVSLSGKPKLTGAPGMVIDLDGTDVLPKKLTGVELLKERFAYFAKLKTAEELERDREKRIKPGMQHFKLKQELEEQIAEQRSLEWAKRLEDEKLHHKEINAHKGEGSDVEEDIDAIEAKLEEKEGALEQEYSTESEEEEESEQEIVDKPRKHNPLVDDEAEESDCDEVKDIREEKEAEGDEVEEENNTDDAGNEADESEDESNEESDESESEQQTKPKKGRILKAFEDSDDEDVAKTLEKEPAEDNEIATTNKSDKETKQFVSSQVNCTQDEELHLAQKSVSEDLFSTSQESTIVKSGKTNLSSNPKENSFEDKDLGTQTFSILASAKENTNVDFIMPDTLSVPSNTQSYDDSLDAVVGMCSGSFSQTQNLVPPSQTAAEVSASQAIGDDVLALCTGKFYDNQFVSQQDTQAKEISEGTNTNEIHIDVVSSPKEVKECNNEDVDSETTRKSTIIIAENVIEKDSTEEQKANEKENHIVMTKTEDPNLKSILDELNDPEFDTPKPNKYFVGNENQKKENHKRDANAQFKKKFIIESDEEIKEDNTDAKKRKKVKKKKLEQRALQISDDEEDEEEDAEEYESELEDNERIVEYDSEENEVIVQPQNTKKRKLGEFFEREAELTSEDEWAGSGDEDERGLDRMEREEGDDDHFNEKHLQRELGQIHMRDVLDQDKREVRLIQELLFEDGDLGAGSRQRKFRWRNADGDDETGTTYEFADTQEEEFESEEQWRKQRHEREMFLKSLKNQENPEESLNVSMNRTSIIKANLSKNTSNLFVEAYTSKEEVVPEKKTVTAKDIPSPQKPFAVFQQNYHGSLLSRGRGALERLAALATPLAAAEDAPSIKSTGKRNFVFATIDAPNSDDEEIKVTKRKAENRNTDTPRLVKKLKTEDKQKYPKSSLLDHMKA